MPTRIGQSFEPRGDSYPVAEDVASLDHNIADINADSKFDAFLGGDLGITLSHAVLNLSRTPYGIDHTGELGQQTVPGGFDDAPSMSGDSRSMMSTRIVLSRSRVPSSSAPISSE
jgi:hypothetical protein